jgi:hypothetical protein
MCNRLIYSLLESIKINVELAIIVWIVKKEQRGYFEGGCLIKVEQSLQKGRKLFKMHNCFVIWTQIDYSHACLIRVSDVCNMVLF